MFTIIRAYVFFCFSFFRYLYRVDQSHLYARDLIKEKRMFLLARDSQYALADWDEKRHVLTGSYVLIRVHHFEQLEGSSAANLPPVKLYTCSCNDAVSQRERLLVTDRVSFWK